MICVCIAENSLDKCLEIISQEELAEVRLDLNAFTIEEIKKIFSSPTPIIATCRKGKYNNQERLILLKTAISSGASYVDIEIDEQDINYLNELDAFVNRFNKCKKIYSYHNFIVTPSLDELKEIVNSCIKKGADIIKIACQVNHNNDNLTLMSLYSLFNNIISFGIGEKSTESRVKAISLGAPFMYASYSKETSFVAGQIDKETLISLMKKL
jgi:3-dehydroquinate dehydratase type I